MRQFLLSLSPVLFLLSQSKAAGIGKAWEVAPYSNDHWNHPSWPRLDSSAFEVRSISGVGHLNPLDSSREPQNLIVPPTELLPPEKLGDNHSPIISDPYNAPYQDGGEIEDPKDPGSPKRILKSKAESLLTKILQGEEDAADIPEDAREDSLEKATARVRRDTENETKLEQIATSKNVRDVRLGAPDSWSSSQPISIEFPHRSLDQLIRQSPEEELASVRSYQPPRADFVTSQRRRSYEHREARDMPPVTRGYEDYDFPWYRNSIRDRDYEPPVYRRGYNYYYPDRYRMERDYYSTRMPQDYSYYYDRYRDEDLDLYGRSRPTPKPKRIIYYATLPEVVRKPVDLRNYPRPYDSTRSQVSRDGTYKRIPGNVDPSRYRYRHLYEGYDTYSKRSSFADRPYGYNEEDGKSKNRVTLENYRNGEVYDQSNDRRKLAQQSAVRNEAKLPWPVQVGTEVSVKDDERIPGRKVFGESDGFERFQSAQMQKAPDATGSSELQSDN